MNIVILTGAVISAESGRATSTEADGLWNGQRIEDVCTPDALERNADAVYAYYDERKLEAAGQTVPEWVNEFRCEKPKN
jgi:NAD-dependent deacetylase